MRAFIPTEDKVQVLEVLKFWKGATLYLTLERSSSSKNLLLGDFVRGYHVFTERPSYYGWHSKDFTIVQ